MTLVIDDSLNDTDYTPAGSVGGTFGTPRRYESITIHHWGSFGQTHMGVVDFFMKPGSPTSAHFVASAGLVHCLVSPQDSAWAAGNAYGNATSIHIECRPEATTGDYATVAELVAFLREHYGANLPLVRHSSWAPTACPGRWDLTKLDQLARTAQPVPLTEMDIDMATPEQVSEALLNHSITIDGETMSYQNWIIRIVRNTRGTLKSEQIITAADDTTKAPVSLVLANLGADVRAIKTKTDRLP